ncbi:lantibiotic dehydratase [Antribacter sp. KLBMP9083]|uniref:Lantibiotic dehydratase n=1 Tax=Antribacter soli TaxID=2910976 RepID=A0AA41UCH2_9MICO|nr:lantibiotic dehydratase [Antribacter soli]MCF4122069.1 lantibiotic dehydratase [Antribacter soli]
MRYTAIDAGLIRVAAFVDSEPGPRPDSTPQDALAWVRRTWREPFASAVELASPDLAAEVARVLSDDDTTSATKIARALGRYLRRATRRATPFGLFAAVSPLTWSAGPKADVGTGGTICPRPDTTWLSAVVDRLEADTDLLRRLTVVRNDLSVVRDGRLVLDFQATDDVPDRTQVTEVSVALTPAVETTLHATADPVPVATLVDALCDRFPGAGAEAAERMVADLVRQRFLTTSLRPSPTDPRPLDHLTSTLRTVGACEVPSAGTAASIQRLTDAFCPVPLETTSASDWRHLAHQMRAVEPHDRPVCADLAGGPAVVLPRRVVREAETAAGLLARLAPAAKGSTVWRDYHQRFLERYGPGALVPLNDLVGAHGLGLPASYRGTRLPLPTPASVSRRDRALLDLAQRCALDRTTEVVLDEDLLSVLASDDLDRVQRDLEVRAELWAPTLDAASEGEFLLRVVGVSRAAGTTVGRFLPVLDPADSLRMSTALAAVGPSQRGAIRVEAVLPPVNRRAGNVTAGLTVLPYVLDPAGTSGRAGRLAWSDLAVTADAHRMILWSLSEDRAVEAVTFTAIEYINAAHPLQRFVCELAGAPVGAVGPFDWGGATAMPFLPRVRAGRAVLAPAQWRLTGGDIDSTDGGWRESLMVPALVRLIDADRRLRLDLDDDADLALLREHVARNDTTYLEEDPGDDGWLGRAHELVLPMAAVDHMARRSRKSLAVSSTPNMPGSGRWLSVKLYTDPDRIPSVLTDHLPRLFPGLTPQPRWWFLPYIDPEPHLRLRIAATSGEHSDLLECVGAWAHDLYERRLVSRLVVDTYLPETGRYGDGAALDAVEDLFVADSHAVMAQLAAAPSDARRALTAASLVDLAAAVVGDEDAGWEWLLRNVERKRPGDNRERPVGVRRLDPDTARRLPGLVDAWAQRADAAARYRQVLADRGVSPSAVLPDLLHVHVVRVHGSVPGLEAEILYAARQVAASLVARDRSRA